MESDAVKRLEACSSRRRNGTCRNGLPDDEFHEEPHHEEAKVPERSQCGKMCNHAHLQKLEYPSKELLCRALRIGGANKIAVRAASELKCDVCSESTAAAKLADTPFVLADSDERVFEFLNIVDLATRFNIWLSSAIQKAGRRVVGTSDGLEKLAKSHESPDL